MKNRLRIQFVLAVSIIGIGNIFSQDIFKGPGFAGMIGLNPAWAGSSGSSSLEISYTGFLPGQKLNLHSLYAGFDNYFKAVRGGAGIWISDNYTGGILNETSGGIAWSYHMQAGRDLYINAGLGAAVVHRGIMRNNIVFPDQIDPLLGAIYPSSETLESENTTYLDIAAGGIAKFGMFTASLSAMHLSRPVFSEGSSGDARLPVRLSMRLFARIPFKGMNNLSLVPVISSEMQNKRLTSGAGISADWGLFSAGTMFVVSENKDVFLNGTASFSASGVLFIYSNTLTLFSYNKMLPASVYHQAGIRISLNNVEKRNTGSTIYFPKL